MCHGQTTRKMNGLGEFLENFFSPRFSKDFAEKQTSLFLPNPRLFSFYILLSVTFSLSHRLFPNSQFTVARQCPISVPCAPAEYSSLLDFDNHFKEHQDVSNVEEPRTKICFIVPMDVECAAAAAAAATATAESPIDEGPQAAVKGRRRNRRQPNQ